MDVPSIITEITSTRQGNAPKYDEGHVALALIIIKENQPIGRISLMKKVGLKEASMKTLIRRMKELGLVETDKIGGTVLTEKGESILDQILKRVAVKQVTLKSIGWDSYGILLRGGESLLRQHGVLELRDEVIKQGAERVLIAVFENGKIEIPPKTDDMAMGNLLQEISEAFKEAKEGDMAIFITPQDLRLALKVSVKILENVNVA
ncbi:DUF4443 domain-containing protein [Sulfuracidifex tepidarius]|uniref:DUF4443 domain-containing protein n=1 Tax=Sulfuracidifex tepidarius TaxID=1294262 RepID=A0A510E3E7_9CREN|nr:DUF4443 domain-containing protein [Sulfuracidifex tepidarius]BBG26588.1 hypothetical protein IC007_1103 [Sulfuracidifex tepidarius]